MTNPILIFDSLCFILIKTNFIRASYFLPANFYWSIIQIDPIDFKLIQILMLLIL